MRGLGAGRLEMDFVPLQEDVRVGDRVITASIDGVYPPGLPVARITAIDRNAAAAFARITCEPLGGVDRRGHVLVLTAKRELPERPVAEAAPASKKKGRRASR